MEMDSSKKRDSVEMIRECLRELTYLERKEHRTKVLNKNRIALGNIVSDSSFTTEFVIKKAKELTKKALSIEKYKQLQNALIQVRILSFLLNTISLKYFISEYRINISILMLIFILLQSEENVNSFLKVNNILFALVRDFSSNDPALQLAAISCCCNIALGNAKACTSLSKSIAPYLITELNSLNYPLLVGY